MSEAVKLVEQPLFVKKTHELQSLLKKIQQGSRAAVDVLIETMDDEDTEPKLRVACAQALIDYEVKITDQINKDQLVRQVAELKAKGLPTPLGPEDRPLPPKVDMMTIQEV